LHAARITTSGVGRRRAPLRGEQARDEKNGERRDGRSEATPTRRTSMEDHV
jgi:hypothetical protein